MYKCLICGKEYRGLPNHLIRTHKISVSDYRDKYGIEGPLAPSSGFADKCWRESNKDKLMEGSSKGGKKVAEIYGSQFKQWGENNPDKRHEISVQNGNKYGRINYEYLRKWQEDNPEERSRISSENLYKAVHDPEWMQKHYEETLLKGFTEKSDWYLRMCNQGAERLHKWNKEHPEESYRNSVMNLMKATYVMFNKKYPVESKFGNFNLRSSYEVRFLEMCESDLTIQDLKYESVTLFGDNKTSYTPDFTIVTDLGTFIIEIKPINMVQYIPDYKFDLVNKYCEENGYEFKIVTESLLFDHVQDIVPSSEETLSHRIKSL